MFGTIERLLPSFFRNGKKRKINFITKQPLKSIKSSFIWRQMSYNLKLKRNSFSLSKSRILGIDKGIIFCYIQITKLFPKEFIKNIKKEAESYIPFNIEEVYLTYFPLRNIQEDGKELTETVLV